MKSLNELKSNLVVEVDRKKELWRSWLKHVENRTLKTLFSLIPAKGCFFYYPTFPAS